MATNDFDSDAMLAFIGELTKRVTDLKKELTDIGAQSGVGMKKAGDEVERFGQSIKRHAGTSVKEMNTGLKDMAINLLSPSIGIAAGLYKVGQALDTFVVGQMRLQNFARDAGFTSRSVQQLQQAGEHMGYTIEETNEIIKNFGGAVNELHLDRQASQLWRDLGRIRDGGYEVAQTIQRMKQEGKGNAEIQAYAAGLIVQQLRRQTDEGNRAAQALSNAFKIPLSFAEQLAGAKKKFTDDDLLVLTPEQRKKQEEYNDAWIGMKREFWKNLQTIEQSIIETLVDAKKKNEEAGGALNRMREEDIKTSREFWNWLTGKGKAEKQSFTPGGDDGDSLPAGARPISFKADELLETEKGSRKLLEEIRDSMMGTGAGGEHPGPGAPGAGPGGGPRGGTLFRPGMRGGGGGAGGGGGGGGTDTAAVPANAGEPNEALAAQRKALMDEINNNPELKEKVYSMLQSEEGGVGPRTAAMEALINRTLMIQKKVPGWTIAKELDSGFYGPINRAKAAGRELPITRGRSRAQSQAAVASVGAGSDIIKGRTDQGMVGDPNTYGPGRVKVPGTGGIFNFWKGRRRGEEFSHEDSRRFAEEQERIAREGAQRPHPSGADQDSPSAAKMSFRPKMRGETDAEYNWNLLNRMFKESGKYGYDPQFGYREGADIPPKGGGILKSEELQVIEREMEGNLAKPWGESHPLPIGPRQASYADADARARINKSLANQISDLGGAHISVDFTGVPKDVKTDAELLDQGVFKTLKLSRTAGQAAMAGSTTAPQNKWVGGE